RPRDEGRPGGRLERGREAGARLIACGGRERLSDEARRAPAPARGRRPVPLRGDRGRRACRREPVAAPANRKERTIRCGVMDVLGPVRRFDRFQQRHRLLAFVIATNKKYSDDQGSFLAAVIAYYGFFSIFPLLLVLTTILGYVLQGHPGAERTLVDSALGQFPVIGPQLQTHALTGNIWALVLGTVGALWAGMGVFLAAQAAMNQLWGIPFRH